MQGFNNFIKIVNSTKFQIMVYWDSVITKVRSKMQVHNTFVKCKKIELEYSSTMSFMKRIKCSSFYY